MDHIILIVNGVAVYDNGATVPPNPPDPQPPKPPETTTPPAGYNGTLTVAGGHYRLPQGVSSWLIPGMTANFAISVAGGDQPTTVTILDSMGNVAQQPWGGPASQTFPAGAGEQWAQVSRAGDYSVQVTVTHDSGQDTINLRT